MDVDGAMDVRQVVEGRLAPAAATSVAADLRATETAPVPRGPERSPLLAQPLAFDPDVRDWAASLGERIVWARQQALGRAEIRLSPEHLGPVSIAIDSTEDGARVHLSAASALVRDALEAALPRLRELFVAQGMEFAGASVGGERGDSRASGSLRREANGSERGAGNDGGPVDDTASRQPESPSRRGRIDTFA